MAATHCKCSLGSGSGSVGRAEVRGLNPVIGKVLYSRTYCQLLKRLKIKGKSGREQPNMEKIMQPTSVVLLPRHLSSKLPQAQN